MKKLIHSAVLAGIVMCAAGCSYGGVAMTQQKAVIVRNDSLLFGLLREVYVCDVTDSGLANCSSSEAP